MKPHESEQENPTAGQTIKWGIGGAVGTGVLTGVLLVVAPPLAALGLASKITIDAAFAGGGGLAWAIARRDAPKHLHTPKSSRRNS